MSDDPENRGAAPLPEKTATSNSSKASDSTMPSEGKAPFIPAWLDDSRMPANQFRVLCHVWRRGETFSTAATIAKVCRLKRDTVFKVLSDLETAGFIRRTPRSGQTTLIEPAPFWGTGENGNPPRLGGQEAPRNGGQDPPRLGGHKGTTIKELPLRKSGDVFFEDPPSRKLPTPQLPFPSEAFAEAWKDWKQHRSEKRKPITPLSAKKSLSDLSKMGEARAIAAINHSIANGWQGIFEPTGPAVVTPTAIGTLIVAGRLIRS